MLKWLPRGTIYKATSGLIEKDSSGQIIDYRAPSEQCTRNAGPIPEGKYYLKLRIARPKYARDDGTRRCNLRPAGAIQRIPRKGDPTRGPKRSEAGKCEPFWANWGWHRIRLEPANTKTANACRPRRGGFYLHDSSKGYTHGCIEVEGAFFTKLIKFAKTSKQSRMVVTVAYKTSITYGGTYVPPAAAGT